MAVFNIGTDHCRLIPPDSTGNGFERFEFLRHLYPYSEAAHRISDISYVLEVGSGEGYGAGYLRSLISHITTIDLSFLALKHAKARYQGIQFCQAVGTALPFASDLFNSIVSFQVIEHIEDVKSYAQEIHRVVKPGGNLFLTTPNRKLRLLPFQKPWNPYHVHEYSGRELRKLLKVCFGSLEIFGIMARPDLMSFETARVKQDRIRILGRIFKRLLQRVFPEFNPQNLIGNNSNKHQERKNTFEKVELSDFYLSHDINHSLDIFVIAKKSL